MPSWSTDIYRPTRNFWLDSFYYLDVSGLPTASDSSTLISNTSNFHANRSGGSYLQMVTFTTDDWNGGYEAGYFIDGTTSTTTVNWTIPSGYGGGPSTPNPQPWVSGLRQENARSVGGTYTPYVYNGFNPETDRHAVLYSPGKLTEAYHYDGSSAKADIVATYDLTSTTLPTVGGSPVGVVAGKIPVAPFAFTYDDLVAAGTGDLGHMLGWVAANYRSAHQWPARGHDGLLGTGYMKAGQVMRLKSTFNVDALTNPYIKVIARTLKKYGVLLYDKNTTDTSPTGTSGRATLFCPSDHKWPTGAAKLSTAMATAFPLSQFEVVDLSSVAGTADSIRVTTAPSPDGIGPVPPTGSAPLTTTFLDAYTLLGLGPTASTYAWNFGDGGTSTDASPTHTYTAAGPYYVTLTVTDTVGGTHNYAKTVVVLPEVTPTVAVDLVQTSASSTLSPATAAPLMVGDRWYVQGHAHDWVFPYPEPSVSLTDTVSLVYRVSLADDVVLGPADKVYGAAVSLETGLFSSWVELTGSGGFTLSRTESGGFAQYTLTYPLNGQPLLSNIYWRFSGVAAASGGPASVTNRLSTTYLNISTTSSPVNLTVGGSVPPVAAFTYAPGGAPGEFVFTDGSTDADGTVVSWSWHFGDGATSTEQSPTHTYTVPGAYTVTLTVTDNGDNTGTETHTVIYAPESPTLSRIPRRVAEVAGPASEPITLTCGSGQWQQIVGRTSASDPVYDLRQMDPVNYGIGVVPGERHIVSGYFKQRHGGPARVRVGAALFLPTTAAGSFRKFDGLLGFDDGFDDGYASRTYFDHIIEKVHRNTAVENLAFSDGFGQGFSGYANLRPGGLDIPETTVAVVILHGGDFDPGAPVGVVPGLQYLIVGCNNPVYDGVYDVAPDGSCVLRDRQLRAGDSVGCFLVFNTLADADFGSGATAVSNNTLLLVGEQYEGRNMPLETVFSVPGGNWESPPAIGANRLPLMTPVQVGGATEVSDSWQRVEYEVYVPPGCRFLVPVVRIDPFGLGQTGSRKVWMTAMAVTKTQEPDLSELYRGT